jgi:FMN-dependent NADH-azoreductase
VSHLLHISSSPRGGESESLRIAHTFLDTYRDTHPDDDVETWDLWDGTLPGFGPAAATAKMTVLAGIELTGAQSLAWREVQGVVERFLAADRLLFSLPMWNAGVPYILKQFIDVVSQPGTIFGVDPRTGYDGLLADQGKKAAVIHASGVWGPGLGPEFGSNFQAPYLVDWLNWTGISEVVEVGFHPTLTGDLDDARQTADAEARAAAKGF